MAFLQTQERTKERSVCPFHHRVPVGGLTLRVRRHLIRRREKKQQMRTPPSALRCTFASLRWPDSAGRDIVFTLKSYLNPSVTFFYLFKKDLMGGYRYCESLPEMHDGP